MPPRCYHFCAALLFVFQLGGPLRAQDEIPAPPWADEYFARQDLRQYLLDAEAYLKAHPDSPWAANVAFEAMMVAAVDDRKETVQAMRRRLLFDFPKSLQANYVLTSFDAEEYAAFLETDLRLDVLSDLAASEQRLEGIMVAWKKWGDDIFNDSEVLLKVAIAAERLHDYRLAEVCQKAIAKNKGKVVEVAAMALDRETTNIEKLTRLAARDKDDNYARTARLLLFANLTPEERRDTETLKIGLIDLIRANYWASVLATADEYLALAPDDCRVRYWRAWALTCQNQCPAALAAAKQLQQQFPDDPWAQAASPLIEALESREAAVDSFVSLKEHLLARKKDVRGIEAWLQFKFEGRLVELYAAGSLADPRLEAVLKRDDKVLFAYRTTDHDSALYGYGDSSIQVADAAGVLPVPKFVVHDVSYEGVHLTYGLGVNLKSNGTLDSLSDIGRELSKLIADRQTLDMQYYRLQLRGCLALPIQLTPEKITVRFTMPSVDEPKPKANELTILAQEDAYRGQFELGEPSQFRLRVNFPTVADYKYVAPAWPDLPEQQCAQIERAAVVRGGASAWMAFERLDGAAPAIDAESAARLFEMK